jgi:acylpyruvate hydrolase
MRCPSSLLSHGRPILLPKVNATLDYEAEMVVVIGKRARHLDVSNALSCIAGYSCADDGSIREFRAKNHPMGHGKEF